VDEKLQVLLATAARIVRAVPEYWAKAKLPEGARRPETGVGGDELLPLMAYTILKANVPFLATEIAFMELLIQEAASIQQEGYLLATMQTGISLVMCMKEEADVLKVVEEADRKEKEKEEVITKANDPSMSQPLLEAPPAIATQ